MAEPFAENRAADREWDAAKAPMIIAKKTAVATSKGRPVGRGPKILRRCWALARRGKPLSLNWRNGGNRSLGNRWQQEPKRSAEDRKKNLEKSY